MFAARDLFPLLLWADSGVVIAKQEPFAFDLLEGGCDSD